MTSVSSPAGLAAKAGRAAKTADAARNERRLNRGMVSKGFPDE
jgi:hypothetical protein